jgi:hypothetical protein
MSASPECSTRQFDALRPAAAVQGNWVVMLQRPPEGLSEYVQELRLCRQHALRRRAIREVGKHGEHDAVTPRPYRA